jgi:small subunit ribosomal protein S20
LFVANTKSAKKEARRSVVRAQRNRSARSAVKTRIVKFRRAVDEGAQNLDELLVVAVSALDRAASKGIVHKNNAARRKARLMKRLSGAADTAGTDSKPKAATAKPAAAKGRKKG